MLLLFQQLLLLLLLSLLLKHSRPLFFFGSWLAVFSLFSIVSFRNTACASASALLSGLPRNGSCFTATECSDRAGASSGGCAAGFGVCCVFVANSAAGGAANVVAFNNTYVQNPGFPGLLSDAGTVEYNVFKVEPSKICVPDETFQN